MEKITFKKIVLFLSTLFLIGISARSTTLYWVGGSGEWHNSNHWSLISGGNGGVKVPASADDVVFDRNSFNSSNENIVLSGRMECRSMTWTSNVEHPTITGAISSSLDIYGSFVVSPQVTWSYIGEVNLKSTQAGNTINTEGKLLPCNINIAGTGSWQMAGSLILSSSSTLNFSSGSISTNDNAIQCGTLKIEGSDYKMLDFNHSVLAIKQDYNDAGASNFHSNSSSSKIYFQNSIPVNSFNTIHSHNTAHNLTSHFSPDVISVDSVIINPTCNGADTGQNCNGAIIIRGINATDGGPFSISWAGPKLGLDTVTADSVFGLCPNTYSYTIYDSASQTVYGPIFVNITAPPPLTTTFIKREERCHGNCDGWIITRISGETPNYTYRWSNGLTGNAIGDPSNSFIDSALCAGTYSIRIKDSNGCVNTFKATIIQPPAITIAFTPTSVTCNGACNGAIAATVSGGHGSYTYTWSPGGQTTATITDLCAGTYSLTAVDDSGCSATASVSITQPTPLAISITSTNVTCNGNCNGSIVATVSGGTPAYTYKWNNGATTSSISSLCQGAYKIVVTDSHGCKDSATVTITEPLALTINISQTNVSCDGNCNGAASATVTGGTKPYTYKWSNGATTSSISSLCAGVYKIVVTDSNKCKDSLNVTITQPAGLVITMAQTNPVCNGDCNGTATATVSGGTPIYTYKWSTGATTSSVSNLCAGAYKIVITDANGCKDSASVTITQPAGMTITTTNTNVNCSGNCIGTATVSVTGGNPPYTYKWSTGATTTNISGLCAGVYKIVVTASGGCKDSANVTITQPNPLLINVTQTNPTCKGDCNGSATANVSGGTPVYTYKWSTGATTSSISGLCAGAYKIVVTDKNGCKDSVNVTITQPAIALSVSTTQTNVTCNGSCNGTATANASGGVPAYTYTWSTGATTSSVSNLCPGVYKIVVKDANGCKDSANVTITQPTPISISTTQTNVNCSGNCIGTATATVSGGTPAYTYKWSTGATTSSVSGLCAGVYKLVVTDNNGCKDSINVTITSPSSIVITTTQTNIKCKGDCNGTATATVSGGASPYTYKWSTGATTSSVSALCAGIYKLVVTDKNGCKDSVNVDITQPATAVTISTSQTNISCNGSCNGTATANASGGTPAYTYKWSNGATTSSISSLCAGVYKIVVTDNNGCKDSVNVTITQPAAIVISIAQTNINCSGNCNGIATATISGGTPAYTYKWSTGATTSSISGLCAGVYKLVVTDNNGCQDSVNVTITTPNPLVITTSQTNVKCKGDCNGIATATVTGGTIPYTYKWSTGATTSSVSGLCAGIYKIVVTDKNGCKDSANVTITQPASALNINFSQTNLTCNGNCNGTATATVTGGTPAYTYAWSTGATTSSVNGLCANTYKLVVTDANGCKDSINVTITQPTAISIIPAQTNITCNGSCNGAASATVSGGTPAYTYAWSTGATTTSISGLCAGAYTLVVTDNNGCQDSVIITITQPNALNISIGQTNVTCNGDCNGTATASVTGGTPIYTFAWSTGSTVSTISGLCPGTYTVVVTDANGCKDSTIINITQPAFSLSVITSNTNVNCNGSCDGTATATASGGTAPYTYAWSPSGGSNATASNLCAGNYTVVVTDANGCKDSITTITITQPTAIRDSITAFTNISCNGSNNGSASVGVIGGTPPYSYSWSPSGGNNATASNLTADTYTVTITDANGCTSTTSVTLTQPPPIIITFTQTNVTCSGNCNGTAMANASGGNIPYTYAWSNGQTTQSISGLCAGTYTSTVTDNTGCSSTAIVNITSPAPLAATVSSNKILCNNSCDGIAIVNVTGGTLPYTYTFSNGTTNTTYYKDTITNLCPGITYTITITDSNNCSMIDSVFFANPPAIAETHTATAASCNSMNDGSINITISGGTPSYTYLWSNGSTMQNLSNILSGTYTLTITDSAGCTFTDTINVRANTTVIAKAGRDTSICPGNSITLNGDNSINAASYKWLTSPGLNIFSDSSIIVVSPTVTTTYILVASNGGCTDTSTITITINPSVTVNAGTTQFINTTQSATLGGSPTGPAGSTYLWKPGFGLNDSTIANPVATPTVTTTYTVYVDNPNGCPNSDTVTVFVVPQLVVPDGFTPNGDGQNDVWVIGFINNYPGCVVEVYNRWGELLFRSVGYNTPWDGTYNGKPVPVGTYYYIINLHDPSNTKSYTGPVTILR